MASGAAGRLTATATGADTVAASGYAAASTSCVDPIGGSLPTGKPCTGGSAAVAGDSAGLRLDLNGIAAIRSLEPFDLARVYPAATPARSVVAQILAGPTTGCPTVGGAGCAYSAAARSLGTTYLGRLPERHDDDTVPNGFDGMVRLTAFSERARAEAGTGERAPYYSRTGTLSYWNGSGYTAVDLSAAAVPASIAPAPVSAGYRGSGDGVMIDVAAAVTIGSTSTGSTGALPCQPQQCSRAVKGSAITVQLTYTVTADDNLITRFVVTANLGSVLVSANHTGAPSA
jgi:hypothetical protein